VPKELCIFPNLREFDLDGGHLNGEHTYAPCAAILRTVSTCSLHSNIYPVGLLCATKSLCSNAVHCGLALCAAMLCTVRIHIPGADALDCLTTRQAGTSTYRSSPAASPPKKRQSLACRKYCAEFVPLCAALFRPCAHVAARLLPKAGGAGSQLQQGGLTLLLHDMDRIDCAMMASWSS
jgi:hypothetical protein